MYISILLIINIYYIYLFNRNSDETVYILNVCDSAIVFVLAHPHFC